MSQRTKWVEDQTLDEEVIEERRVKVKGNREKGRIKIIGQQKKKMVIPQEMQIHTVKSVKRASNERVTA